MTFWIGLRTKIRKLVMNNETNFIRGTRFVMALLALAMININFGYQKALSHWWTALIVAAICAFIPSQAGSVVVAFVCIVQLMALSTDVGVAALVIAVVAYAVTAYFKAQNQYNNVAIAVSHQMKIPFIIPVVSGLLGNFNDMSGVVCGSVVAYYLKVVKENASAFLDEIPRTALSRSGSFKMTSGVSSLNILTMALAVASPTPENSPQARNVMRLSESEGIAFMSVCTRNVSPYWRRISMLPLRVISSPGNTSGMIPDARIDSPPPEG